MASILRQIVAGPRARHPEARLDLCYVTDFIIATSGPSQTYPQLAYRNPLDQLVDFLDSKHGDNWAIWEFRAEGTGYPDEAVYGRVRHYPWPDHHPPPFRLVPMIMASMRNWLHGGDLHGSPASHSKNDPASLSSGTSTTSTGKSTTRNKDRVVVVHCKAGKGRSGTMATSYLISEEGWSAEDALERFTARRMRPKFGAGVSIPSQLRWVSYVDRWTKHGKKYLDRPIEIVEIHIWGLRNGVKVDVEGFVQDGKKIQVLHTFSKDERVVVEAGAPRETGIGEMFWDLAGYSATGGANKAPSEADFADAANQTTDDKNKKSSTSSSPEMLSPSPPQQDGAKTSSSVEKKRHSLMRKGPGLIQKVSANVGDGIEKAKTKTSSNASTDTTRGDSTTTTTMGLTESEDPEPGGLAVIFKPSAPIRVPTSDVNIAVERRNRSPRSVGWTMVSAVAHVWFNAFFEGKGPENGGRPADGGVFSIDWEALDGIKGSSRKGSRAMDRMSVVWRAAVVDGGEGRGEEILEPAEGEPVPQVAAADWKGVGNGERDLGLRVQTDGSRDVSRASSLKSVERTGAKEGDGDVGGSEDGKVMEWVRSSGPSGEDLVGR